MIGSQGFIASSGPDVCFVFDVSVGNENSIQCVSKAGPATQASRVVVPAAPPVDLLALTADATQLYWISADGNQSTVYRVVK